MFDKNDEDTSQIIIKYDKIIKWLNNKKDDML